MKVLNIEKTLFKSLRRKIVFNLKSCIYGPFSVLRNLNICMWHSGRCGSSVVADLIKQDGRIDWGGEILEIFSNNPPPKLINSGNISKEVYRKINKRQRLAGYRPFGFEMKHRHYERLKLEFDEVLKIVKQLGFNKNIILERKNYLRVIVSATISQKTGKWHKPRDQRMKLTKIKVNVSNDGLLNNIKFHEHFYHELKDKLPQDLLYLCYEDDIESDPFHGYKKVIQYCGLSPKAVPVRFKRMNPQRLSDIIENYDEVVNYLANTPYHWMIKS